MGTGDFNLDGYTDIVVANWIGASVSILLNNGDGTFAAYQDYPVGPYPFSVTVGDYNQDGHPDMATGNSQEVSILMNNGDGTFESYIYYALTGTPGRVNTADYNQDSYPDISVARVWNHTVAILMNNGDGTFAHNIDYPTVNIPISLATADFNKDGFPDISTGNRGSSTISVLINNGDGTFAGHVDYATASWLTSHTVGDFNQDSYPDVSAASWDDVTVSVLLNNGDGSLAGRIDYYQPERPTSITVSDLNQDGFPDIATVSYYNGYDTVSILINNEDGTFVFSDNQYKIGSGPTGIASGDFNQDGLPDLVVSNGVGNSVSVLINNSSPEFDTDGDGIPDDQDLCPLEDATGLDADLDGCIDTSDGLIDLINQLPPDALADELKNSLITKVRNADKQGTKENICAAVNILETFQIEVEAQRISKIVNETATELINYADNLIVQYLDSLPFGETCGP